MDQLKYVLNLFANTNLIGDYNGKLYSNNCTEFDEIEAKNITLLSFHL